MYHLDRSSKKPLYQQLYEQIKIEYLETSEEVKMPSIRLLAEELNISKTTVEQAYNQLVAEGSLLSVPQSGFYFLPVRPEAVGQDIVDSEKLPLDFDFRYGTTFFYTSSWNNWKRCIRLAMHREFQEERMRYHDVQGNEHLRDELVKMLRTTRGVSCKKEQIVITSGSLDSLAVVLDILTTQGNFQSAIENPGYHGAYEVFRRYGLSPELLSVTEEGLSIKELQKSTADLVYVTPSHQFPLGYRMPVVKRQQLLQVIDEREGYILEDDYDSEFRYTTQPLPSLQSLDRQDRVIYMGSFSKTVSPTIRLGYLILPERLLESYRQLFQYDHERVSYMIQEGMAEFIQSGGYYRHISKAVAANKAKYKLLISELSSLKKDRHIEWIAPDGGLHIILKLKNEEKANIFREELSANRIRLYSLDKYFFSGANGCCFLLGYGGLSIDELREGLTKLLLILEKIHQ
ncbi:PLP-dependent aminotransferase family protein [Enterococcus sp. BWM-S5]|uniref:PLP-dependent aminotransferase family protein n=1 Tax=Enterococcus larvae TaxID=2794352 RepID=A0ABS4CM59_9ENTE|nr:PLP-dependent aminotransferase family protein [Enterococcus larvae]MBP1047258.1 PLP-dependent aminotransferase family protein [Enterococcus larvae]